MKLNNILDENNTVKSKILMGIIGKEEMIDLLRNKDFTENVQIDNIALISIIDPDQDFLDVELTKSFNNFLQIKFWDIEEDFAQYKTIIPEQGKEIKNFIITNKDKKFLVHCSAGISRSAGVGCAIECLVNYNGNNYAYQTGNSDVKSHWRYSPNFTVFKAIING